MTGLHKLALAALLAFSCTLLPALAEQPVSGALPEQVCKAAGHSAVEEAFHGKRSKILLSGKVSISKLLQNDNKGSRHQRFLAKINPEQTLLFAHNIDLAPRVPLQPGDEICFYGEYVYNPKGGVIHWTHHDPQGTHAAGWIMHLGRLYQ